MATNDPLPTLPDPASRDRRTGRLLLGSGLFNLVSLVVIAALAFTVAQQAGVIGALSGSLTQQRSQFEACKDKPGTARGCTTPVAAAPEVIVKQGGQGLPGVAGAVGATGPQGAMGPAGPAGPQGPRGVPGPAGKAGPPPGCALLSTACIGATGPSGPVGPAGADGKDGNDGAPGADGQDGKPGADGQKGDKGEAGRGIVDQYCPADDNDPATDQAWVMIWSQEPLQTSGGVCRAKTAP